MTALTLYFDGGSRAGGQGAIGAAICNSAGTPFAEVSETIGKATCNEAEYRALIAGLRRILAGSNGHTLDLEIYSDSSLVVNQVSGSWQVKSRHLHLLRQEAIGLLRRFGSWKISWVPREQNAYANKMVNLAFKESEIALRQEIVLEENLSPVERCVACALPAEGEVRWRDEVRHLCDRCAKIALDAVDARYKRGPFPAAVAR